MPNKEEWKWLKDYAGKYLISNHGRVRSFCLDPYGKLKAQTKSPNGYMYVSVGGWKQVHILVCQTFKGPKPTSKHEVAHIDGNRSHNWSSNLEWKTRSQNNRDQDVHGTRFRPRGEKQGRSKLTTRQVKTILRKHASGVGVVKLAREYGVAHGTIGYIIRGINWAHVIGKRKSRG